MSANEYDPDRTYSVVKMELTVKFWSDYHSPNEFEMCEGWITHALDDRDGVRGVTCEVIDQTYPNA